MSVFILTNSGTSFKLKENKNSSRNFQIKKILPAWQISPDRQDMKSKIILYYSAVAIKYSYSTVNFPEVIFQPGSFLLNGGRFH